MLGLPDAVSTSDYLSVLGVNHAQVVANACDKVTAIWRPAQRLIRGALQAERHCVPPRVRLVRIDVAVRGRDSKDAHDAPRDSCRALRPHN